MRIIVLIISLTLFFGCGLKQNQNNNNVAQEEVLKAPLITKEKAITKENLIDKELLLGIWGEDIDENASFWIENDSMYFLEDQDNPAPIQVINDTLITDYEGFVTSDKIYTLTKDSLVLINEIGDTLRMVRIK